MIAVKGTVFGIHGEGFSCLLRVNAYGMLEQLHFGAPVETEDWEAFCCRPGPGWGTPILLDQSDSSSCPEAMPLAWSGSGRGDYRESPLELGVPTDFRYENYRLFDKAVPMESGLPQAKGECETLEITMVQDGLRLKLYFSVFGGVLTRKCVLENISNDPVVIQKIMSFSGGWIAEMRKHTCPVTASRVVNESTTGFSSNGHNPGFMLSRPGTTEESGEVFGINLIYSGNHYSSAQKSLQGMTRVMQGISHSEYSMMLEPGCSMETPEAVICYSNQGFGGMSHKMHCFVNWHIIPEYWRGKGRPVLFNSWEGCLFDFDHRRLLNLAKDAKELGCELFVLDDGWFGNRNDDTSGLGDYTVDRKKLPRGLGVLSKQINEMGLEFGLWFEPEAVNVDSKLYRCHPDWTLTDSMQPLFGRNELLLDLTKPEVRDYIVEQVSGILDSANISYVKWDMNRHSTALGVKAHQYILGLYDVLKRIFECRPHILLESCASGGNRCDLGMLCFSPQIWCSDNTDPVERMTIQGNLSYLYPQSAFGSHVSAAPHSQTLRHTPLETRGNVSFFGILGYELDLKHLVRTEKEQIKEQIAFYKSHRKIFQFGRFYRLENGWQVSLSGTSIASVFRKMISAAPGYEQLRLRDMDSSKRYHVKSRPQKMRIGQFGALVKYVAPVNINPNGTLFRIADRLVTLPDGIQEVSASGSALMAGFQLLPLFRGTGYDINQRTLTDYGSELFVIEEEEK